MHDHLVSALEPRPGERWLDVATGTGAVAIRAAERGVRVTAIDIAPQMVRHARANATATGVNVEFLVGDAESSPFRTPLSTS
ncbi:MAG: class I SAM-dependent methyltransferase [Gaiellaceae bacterium]